MKKPGVMVLILIGLLLVFSVFASHNNKAGSGSQITISNGFEAFREEVCVDGIGNKTCTENTYIKCNGEIYNVPKPTGLTIYKNIIEREYVEKECNNEILSNKEKPSPFDRINENNIEIYNNKIIINIKNPNWRNFIDSNSMDPLIDEGTTTIEILPKSEEEIKVGDIVSYSMDDANYTTVHRVVGIGNDENGTFFITKGDNYFREDSYKVRFSQIDGIVVGILY